MNKITTKIIGFFLLSFFVMLAVSYTKPVMVPSDLIGKWVTEAPRYEDRYIEINKEDIIFGAKTETEDPTFFMIKKIKENKIGKFVEWSFHCKTFENASIDIVLFYTKDEDGAYFEQKNQRQVQWKRTEND